MGRQGEKMGLLDGESRGQLGDASAGETMIRLR
jgi:hypothetical protein